MASNTNDVNELLTTDKQEINNIEQVLSYLSQSHDDIVADIIEKLQEGDWNNIYLFQSIIKMHQRGNQTDDVSCKVLRQLSALTQTCEQGVQDESPRLISLHGLLHMMGIGVEEHLEKAFKLFTKASELGDVNANLMLGHFYLEGIWVNQDIAIAESYYRKAIESGSNMAKSFLASALRQRSDASEHAQEITALLGDALTHHCPIAAGMLTEDHTYGNAGCSEDKDMARYFCSKALLYSASPSVLTQYARLSKPDNAVKFYQLASTLGDEGAMYDLAMIYHQQGQYKNARPLLEQASDLGYKVAMLALGLDYLNGLGGKQNLSSGYRLLRKSAELFKEGLNHLSQVNPRYDMIFSTVTTYVGQAILHLDLHKEKSWLAKYHYSLLTSDFQQAAFLVFAGNKESKPSMVFKELCDHDLPNLVQNGQLQENILSLIEAVFVQDLSGSIQQMALITLLGELQRHINKLSAPSSRLLQANMDLFFRIKPATARDHFELTMSVIMELLTNKEKLWTKEVVLRFAILISSVSLNEMNASFDQNWNNTAIAILLKGLYGNAIELAPEAKPTTEHVYILQAMVQTQSAFDYKILSSLIFKADWLVKTPPIQSSPSHTSSSMFAAPGTIPLVACGSKALENQTDGLKY